MGSDGNTSQFDNMIMKRLNQNKEKRAGIMERLRLEMENDNF